MQYLISILISFIISLAAGIASYFICKWLEGDK